MQTSVKAVPESQRFELFYDGDLAGFAEYLDHDGQRIFHHTEIGSEFGGKGLGSTLISDALTETVQAGLRIVPVCPFVANFLKKHDDFAGSVDEVTDQVEALLKSR